MQSDYYDLDSSLGYLTVVVNRLLSAFFRKRLGEAGLDMTGEQWGVLCRLCCEDKVYQDELAGKICLEKSSLSRVLDVLERKGLVRRERDPSDARRKILIATPDAEAIMVPCKKVADDLMEEVLKDCTPSDLETCLKVLKQVRSTIKDLSSDS